MGNFTISFDFKNLKGASLTLKDIDGAIINFSKPQMTVPDVVTAPVPFTPNAYLLKDVLLIVQNNTVANLKNGKTLIRVENSSDPNYTYVVDASTPTVANKYKLTSGNNIALWVAKLSKNSDDANIKVTIYNTDGIIDYHVPQTPPTTIRYTLTNVEQPAVTQTTLNGDTLTLKANVGSNAKKLII